MCTTSSINILSLCVYKQPSSFMYSFTSTTLHSSDAKFKVINIKLSLVTESNTSHSKYQLAGASQPFLQVFLFKISQQSSIQYGSSVMKIITRSWRIHSCNLQSQRITYTHDRRQFSQSLQQQSEQIIKLSKSYYTNKNLRPYFRRPRTYQR